MTDFETELKNNGVLVFTSKGTSMLPLIRENSDLVVIRALKEKPKLYDVVLFKRKNGQYVLHRITKLNNDGSYYIIGDNCLFGETVKKEDILGVLSEIKRDGAAVTLNDGEYLKKLMRLRKFRIIKRRFRRILSKIYHFFVR